MSDVRSNALMSDVRSNASETPMHSPPPLDASHVAALRAVAARFGGEHPRVKAKRLRACAARAIVAPDVLLAYHDLLLFLLAYPESRALLVLAGRELRRVADAARVIAAQGPARDRARLRQSGIAWSEVTADFSLPIARWLCARQPGLVAFDSFGADPVPLAAVLHDAFPSIEQEMLARCEHDPEVLLTAAAGDDPAARLAWLVGAFDRLQCTETLRDHLFASLRPYLTIRPAGSALSRTFVRGLPASPYFHREELLCRFEPQATVGARLPAVRPLTAPQRSALVDAARATLAALGRETDAVTLADPKGVRHFALERGIGVALFTMLPDRRHALDSHVGFVLFKNGLPVGYGGAWPFLGSCRIGVNIFAPYRGGESALLFCQVLRVYRQQFGVARFVVESTQYGGGNREGLESGAFWFYYRLGFRPVDARQAGLAAAEFARMQAEPGYRTPIQALRRFTRADIEWRLGTEDWYGDRPHGTDPADVSLLATRWIATRFAGDRTRAEAAALRHAGSALGVPDRTRWPAAEQRAFASLALVVAQIPGLARWPAADKRALVALMRAKGGDEFRFHDLLRRHHRLRVALDALTAQAAEAQRLG
jgi:hypothetical protein